jgi:hypothetical protein
MEKVMAILGVCYCASWWASSFSFLCCAFWSERGFDLLVVLTAEKADARAL